MRKREDLDRITEHHQCRKLFGRKVGLLINFNAKGCERWHSPGGASGLEGTISLILRVLSGLCGK